MNLDCIFVRINNSYVLALHVEREFWKIEGQKIVKKNPNILSLKRFKLGIIILIYVRFII